VKLCGRLFLGLLTLELSSQFVAIDVLGLPGRDARVEESIDLLKGTALGFRASQVNVNTSSCVHAGIEEVSLVVNALHHRRSPFSKTSVESPVGGSGKSDSLGTDTKREDFSRVSP
jgi:hypothetical protein